ncbi:hypothetical protein BC829DRAFT_383757 [Chytridium lagenaria]|nr:hypothetical protein BC829DRAFT_383757 [Chytridium lagenaria]
MSCINTDSPVGSLDNDAGSIGSSPVSSSSFDDSRSVLSSSSLNDGRTVLSSPSSSPSPSTGASSCSSPSIDSFVLLLLLGLLCLGGSLLSCILRLLAGGIVLALIAFVFNVGLTCSSAVLASIDDSGVPRVLGISGVRGVDVHVNDVGRRREGVATVELEVGVGNGGRERAGSHDGGDNKELVDESELHVERESWSMCGER